MRILVIEDDAMIGAGIRQGLMHAGFAVDWVTDGHAAEAALGNGVYDLAVLDLGLPKKGGMAVLAGLRAARSTLPVLVVSARDTLADRIAGLEGGADDYMLKPFDLDELLARVRSLVRRGSGRHRALFEHKGIVLDPAAMTCTLNGERVALSRREFAMLELLLRERGQVLTRARIEDSLYAWGDEIESNAVQVHVHHLRRKFGEDLIRTVRGVGYTIDTP